MLEAKADHREKGATRFAEEQGKSIGAIISGLGLAGSVSSALSTEGISNLDALLGVSKTDLVDLNLKIGERGRIWSYIEEMRGLRK